MRFYSSLIFHARTWRAFVMFVVLMFMVNMLSLGAPFHVEAASLTFMSDTLSNSSPSVGSNHLIAWTASTTVTTGQTIKIQFDPTTDAFDLTSVVAGDISATGFTIVANIGACTVAASEAYPVIDSSAPDENITFTVCTGDTISTGAKTVTIGNTHLLNPAGTGSYIIRIAGTQADSGDTRVAILNFVTVTASVNATLTFTVNGLGVGQTINVATTSTTTTSTAIGFGILAPATPQVAGQELTVATNATNGFTVTVQENQNLLSNNGADIDLFKDGAATAVPTTWTSPVATLGSEATYGHIGVTSNDSDLNAGEFTGQKFAGNFFAAPRTVFSNTGPADGVTQNIGLARVAYKVEVSALQEAASDYTNRIFYVCTPSF